MFESLKSAETLERELREWYYHDRLLPYIKGGKQVPHDDANRIREAAVEYSVQTLIRFGISSILLTNHEAKSGSIMGGARR